MPSPLTSTRLPVNDAIFGWSPIGGDDEDVNVSPDLFFMTIQSLPSSTGTFLSPICPSLNAAPSKPCPPPSQSSYPQPKPQSQPHSITPSSPLRQRAVSNSPSSDRRAQRNRNRDPSWIPRPRNAFIIFRCEFSREHTQGSKDSQNDEDDDPNNAAVKTLSKRAAEAWKQLTPFEKERYKIMADKEREEHARLYPHYRFRPMKRQMSGTSTRKTALENVEGSKAARVPSTERPCAPLTQVPSVLSSAPEKSRTSPSMERGEEPISVLPVPPPSSFKLADLQGSSCSTDAPTDPQVPLQLDFTEPSLFSTALSSESPSAVDLYTPLPSIPFDTFRCYDPAFGLDRTKEDLEQAKDLEAYAIGLYNVDLFSPFSFPEYS